LQWHEPQYEHLLDHVVQSSDIKNTNFAADAVICSLAQLHNHQLLQELGALHHLIIDETSQISAPHVSLVLYQHQELQKVTFVGDPMQLAPFMSEQSDALASVYGVQHESIQMHLLDLTYRIPFTLTKFISENMYDDRLKSEKPPSDQASLVILDCVNGQERISGTGYKVSFLMFADKGRY